MWNIISYTAVRHGCLIDPAPAYIYVFTILKYPFNIGNSDGSITNNIVGESRNFLGGYIRPIFCGLYRGGLLWALLGA